MLSYYDQARIFNDPYKNLSAWICKRFWSQILWDDHYYKKIHEKKLLLIKLKVEPAIKRELISGI